VKRSDVKFFGGLRKKMEGKRGHSKPSGEYYSFIGSGTYDHVCFRRRGFSWGGVRDLLAFLEV